MIKTNLLSQCSASPLGVKGVKIICELLELNLAVPSIIVSGTKGRGSVAFRIANILKYHDFHVGLFTFPNSINNRNRNISTNIRNMAFIDSKLNQLIKINGSNIQDQDLEHRIEKILELASQNNLQPTFHEMMVILSLWYFEDHQVDMMILEAGLDGKEEPTSILWPICSVISTINNRHIDGSGDEGGDEYGDKSVYGGGCGDEDTDLSSIVNHKTQMIKKHTPVFVGESDEEVFDLIKAKVIDKSAPLVRYKHDYNVQLKQNRNFYFIHQNTKVMVKFSRILAPFEMRNMALALRVICYLKRLEFITPEYNPIKLALLEQR